MAQCLVTKLQGIIKDDSLLKLGELRLQFNNLSPNIPPLNIKLSDEATTEELTIVALKGYFTDQSYSNNLGTEITIKAGRKVDNKIYVSPGTLLSIRNKYLITDIYFDAQDAFSIDFDMDIFSGCNKIIVFEVAQTNQNTTTKRPYGDIKSICNSPLQYVFLKNCDIEGDISSFYGVSTLKEIDLRGSKVGGNIAGISTSGLKGLTYFYASEVTGNIKEFGSLTKLQRLHPGSKVIGSIEELAESMISNGRNSGTLDVFAPSVTYGGIAMGSSSGKLITFNGNTYSVA